MSNTFINIKKPEVISNVEFSEMMTYFISIWFY